MNGVGFRALGFRGLAILPRVMANQLEVKTENDMETGVMQELIGIISNTI